MSYIKSLENELTLIEQQIASEQSQLDNVMEKLNSIPSRDPRWIELCQEKNEMQCKISRLTADRNGIKNKIYSLKN